jgi:hypothetical protein
MLAEVIPDTAASPREPRAPGAAARLPWSALLALAVLVGSTALVVFAGAIARRRPLWPLLATALVILALVANAVVATSLTFAYTI